MKYILLLFFSILINFHSTKATVITATSTAPSNFGCLGTITITVSNACGGGFYAWGSHYPNGSSVTEYYLAGTWEVAILEDCPNGPSSSTYVTVPQGPPCNMSVYIDSVTNVSNYACNDGAISSTGYSTICGSIFNVNSNSGYNNYYADLYRDSIFQGSPPIPTPFNTSRKFENLPAGNYYIVVTNGSCTDTSSIISITQPSCNMNVSIDSVTSISNYNCNDGMISITGHSTICGSLSNSNATGSNNYQTDLYRDGNLYNYPTLTPFNTVKQFTNLPIGNYYAVVSNGACSDTSNIISINQPSCEINGSIITISNNVSFLANSGVISVTANSSPCIGYAYAGTYRAYLFRNNSIYQTYQDASYNSVISFSSLDTANYFVVVHNGWCTDTIHIPRIYITCKLFIEGYYLGNGVLANVLFNQGVEAIQTNHCDTITIELHNAAAPYILEDTYTGLLNTDGTIICSFPYSISNNSYYITIKHRNALLTWSSLPVSIFPNLMYDFSSSSNKAYGNNQVEVELGVWAFYLGDLNLDENIDLLDVSILETDISNFQFGYFATDLNGDGNVDLLDNPIIETNVGNFIFSNHP